MRPPRLRWVVWTVFLGVSLAILWTSCSYELLRMQRLTNLLDRKMNTLVQLQRKLEKMRERLSYVQTEEGVLELAREDLNMVRPNERIFWLEYDEPEQTSSQGVAEQ